LIDESLSRWGGRRTPLIPTDGESISPEYIALLNLWDADIIYSYVKLSELLERKLYHCFAPCEISFHDATDGDTHDLQPDYAGNFDFLSALSLLPQIARGSQIRGEELRQILDKEYSAEVDRDLEDSFGFVSSCGHDPLLLPHARRLSFRPKVEPQGAPRFSEPTEIAYIEEATLLIETIAKRRDLLTVARLSDMFCPYLNQMARGREGWNDHLTVVVGDAVADRLLFWNAQHRYRALGIFDDIPVLRISTKRFEDGVPEWLKHWVLKRNRRHLDGNSAARTVLRSCSVPKGRLDEIAAGFNTKHIILNSEHHSSPCVFNVLDEAKKANGLSARSRSRWSEPGEKIQSITRFQNSQFELPTAAPRHISDIPVTGLTTGLWAADLMIERAEDHSAISNERHTWKWPRRLRLERAVRLENYARHMILPPRIRPTQSGDLTVWDEISWPRLTLHLPNDSHAFFQAIAQYGPGSPEEKKAIEADQSPMRFWQVSVSDKGRDLLGVLQFFQSLPEALSFLTNDYWGKVFARLSPEEAANKKKNIDDLVGKLREMISEETHDKSGLERIARRALSLANRSLTSPTELLKAASFEVLLTWAMEGKAREKRKEIEECLIESVTYLRDREFLWQGFGWRCSFCQHHNWVSLERLTAVAKCEICRKPESSPVSKTPDFRLNPFAQHAFGSTSAQAPVIWCLNQLAGRAAKSFAFIPAVDLYRYGQSTCETDLDIVAAVDGRVYLAEVKSGFAAIEQQSFEQLLRLANELRPDVLMLAVMTTSEQAAEHQEAIETLGKKLSGYDVQFELLTLEGSKDQLRLPRYDIPIPLGKHMNWSAW